MEDNEPLVNGPARDAHLAAIRQRIEEVFGRAREDSDGRVHFADGDWERLQSLGAELTAYRETLDN
jgi:hypothetical protein